MYNSNFKYSKNKIFILGFDSLTNNKLQKGFLELKIFSSEGMLVDNANISVFAADRFNEYNINIDAFEYEPVQINNVQFYPGYICKLNVNLIPSKSNNQTLSRNIKIFHIESELPQNEVRELTMSLGMSTPKGSPSYLYAEKFADEVNKLSDGKIKIDINTDAKLGTDRQMLQNILDDGNIDLIVTATPQQANFMPKLSVFDIPMVYDNVNDLRKVIDDKEFYEKISEVYKDGGYKLLGFADPKLKQLSTKKVIQNIDDFKGIKIRTIQNKNHEAFWDSLGAIIIPLPLSEIYRSLLFGYIDSIDSTDNPYEFIETLKLYEVQDYLIHTNHLPLLENLITSDKYYNSLTSAEKAIIDEAAANATAYDREKADERFEEGRKMLVDSGMTILDLPYETKLAMRSKAMPIYEKIREEINDDELINLYFGNKHV